MRLKIWLNIFLVFFISSALAGCTFIFQKGTRSDSEKIGQLSTQVDELSNAKRLLEERLKKEIADKDVRLEMAEKGLVITFVADILFDSGKAKLKPQSYAALDKVSRVLSENTPRNNIGIEGHTDNEPIKYSGWKSNWELSTARALSVLHYLVDEKGVSPPQRVQAIGCGEYRPVSSNDSKEGRRLNRRVEIIILPQATKVSKTGKSQDTFLAEPAENLK